MYGRIVIIAIATSSLALASDRLSEGACGIMYLKEPYPDIECNPYASSSTFNLQCQVQAPAYLGSRLQILWFFTNRNQQTILINMITLSSLVSIVSEHQTQSGKLLLTSTITFGQFSDPTYAGSYFCQVALDGSTDLFLPSVPLTFDMETPSHAHSRQPCGQQDSYIQNVRRCTEIISASTVDTENNSTTLSLWLYVLVGMAILEFIIVTVLMIICIKKCHQVKRGRNNVQRPVCLTPSAGNQNESEPCQESIAMDVNDAYGCVEERIPAANEPRNILAD